MATIKACIFDCDGLLLDTERIYSLVTEEIVGRYGHQFEYRLKAKMMGRRERESAEILVNELKLPITPEEYLVERNAMQKKLFPSCKALPGVSRLIRHLKTHQIPIAVATSSHRASFELKILKHGELFSLFDAIICGDNREVEHGKPAPDIFLAAAKRLPGGPYAPENILVFEDAHNGVQAGLAAGMHVCWVPDPRALDLFESENGKKKHGATLVLKTLEDFHPDHFELPALKHVTTAVEDEVLTEKSFGMK